MADRRDLNNRKGVQDIINGAASVTLAAPNTQVTGEIASVATAEVTLETTGATVFAARYTLNAVSDVGAGAALINGHPDCGMVNADESVTIGSSVAITRIDVVGVGDAKDTASYVIEHDSSTESDARTAMRTFVFDSADNVKTVVVSLSPTWNSSAEVLLRVEGYSHG